MEALPLRSEFGSRGVTACCGKRSAGIRTGSLHRREDQNHGASRLFGWIKAQAGFDQVKVRGLAKAAAVFTFAVAAYNLIRIPKAARASLCLTLPGPHPSPRHP